jgi:RNA polymerase-binding transcription factor DksA
MAKSKKPKSAPKKAASKPAAKSARVAAHAKAKHANKAKPAAKAKHAEKPKAAEKAKPAANVPASKVAKAAPVASAKTGKVAKGRGLLRPKLRPEAFSLDEVLEIAKANSSRKSEPVLSPEVQAAKAREAQIEARFKKAATPHHVKAASLADILGYNPAKQASPGTDDISRVEPRFQKYFKMLIQLRDHVQTGLSEHAEDTLKRSSKDDAGDLSGYGQHMADAGTDTFDRDFALSLVSSEQEALSEIEAAIKRVHAGTYGICEATQKPIAKDRLLAVPFTRYSTEAKKQVERHSHRAIQRGGLFGDGTDEEGGKIADDSGGDDD